MRLLSLHLRDFRNVVQADLKPSARATVLVGPNGQGKTNLLEAVYLLCTLKPLRASRLAELVRFGAERARVEADLDGPGGTRRVAVEIGPAGRTAWLDGKPLGSGDRLEAWFEGPAAVCFSPDDLLLVKGGPELRRRFLDRAAFNRWPAVLEEARDYVRALRARNAALRSGPPEVEESFRAGLVRSAARLLVRRHALVEELAPRLAAAFREISGPAAAEARLGYRPAAGMPARDGLCLTRNRLLLIIAADAGPIAQRLELPAHNRSVAGSNPAGPTTNDSLSLSESLSFQALTPSGYAAPALGPKLEG